MSHVTIKGGAKAGLAERQPSCGAGILGWQPRTPQPLPAAGGGGYPTAGPHSQPSNSGQKPPKNPKRDKARLFAQMGEVRPREGGGVAVVTQQGLSPHSGLGTSPLQHTLLPTT